MRSLTVVGLVGTKAPCPSMPASGPVPGPTVRTALCQPTVVSEASPWSSMPPRSSLATSAKRTVVTVPPEPRVSAG